MQNILFPPLMSYLHSATFENGDLYHLCVYMYGLHIGDGRPVIPVFIVSMDLKVGHSCVIAWTRHQIAAVAHEVIFAFVKAGVVWIARCDARGCT